MIKTSICKYCGKSFEWDWVKGTRGHGPGFCCDDHRRKQINRKTNERQKEAKRAKGVISQKVCVYCGKRYDYSYGSNKHYCSDECAKLANQPHICKQCGKEFPHKHNSLNVFCGRACCAEYKREHPEINANKRKPSSISKTPLRMKYQCICEVCGKAYKTTSETRTWCSDDCYRKIQIKRQHERNKAKFVPRKVICKECGKEFVTTFGSRKQRVFCSHRCMQLWCQRKGTKNYEMRKRKALIDTDISLKALFKRDKGICYLCGKQADWDDCSTDKNGAFITGPNYPSIDHVFPISKGGKHSWNNVKLAHHRCNTLKRDKVLTVPTNTGD